MKIGVDASCWTNPRGYGRFTRELLKAMVAIGKECEFIFFIDEISYQKSDFPERVDIVKVPSSKAATEAAAASGYRSPLDIYKMGRAVTRQEMDILFYPAGYTYFPALAKAKSLVTIHDVIPEMYPEMVFPDTRSKIFWKLKTWLALRQADHVLTVSHYSKKGIVEYLNVDPEKISVTIEAADAQFQKMTVDSDLQRVILKLGLSFADHYFLYLGGMGAHKNLKTLIDAFLIFKQTFPNLHQKLLLVGDYENDAFWIDYDIQQQAQDRDNRQIIFTGYIEDEMLPYLYSGADALIMPSFSEGFGLPALEAMSCGTAVVGSETTSLPEIVGDAGIYFNPWQPPQLAKCMERICNESGLKEQLGRTALERSKIFTWEKAANIVLETMKNLVVAPI